MFNNLQSIQQEVKAKQARFQSEATRQTLLKACAIAEQSGENSGHQERKHPWFFAFRLRLVRQPK